MTYHFRIVGLAIVFTYALVVVGLIGGYWWQYLINIVLFYVGTVIAAMIIVAYYMDKDYQNEDLW